MNDDLVHMIGGPYDGQIYNNKNGFDRLLLVAYKSPPPNRYNPSDRVMDVETVCCRYERLWDEPRVFLFEGFGS